MDRIKNLVRLGVTCAMRTKSNLLFAVVVAFVLSAAEAAYFGKFWLHGGTPEGALSQMLLNAVDTVFSLLLAALLLFVVLFFALKVKDNAKHIALLRMLGYRERDIALVCCAEHLLLLVPALVALAVLLPICIFLTKR